MIVRQGAGLDFVAAMTTGGKAYQNGKKRNPTSFIKMSVGRICKGNVMGADQIRKTDRSALSDGHLCSQPTGDARCGVSSCVWMSIRTLPSWKNIAHNLKSVWPLRSYLREVG